MAAQENAIDALRALFADYHLEDLVYVVDEILKDNLGEAEAIIKLKSSTPYMERFAGNEGRASKLTEGEYLQLEQDYRDKFAAYMLPADFYDDPKTDFVKLIQNNISPDEVGYRAQKAWDFAMNGDPAIKDTLAEWYGLTSDNDIVAYFLDPEKGQALVQRREQAATMGAAARRNNFQIDRASAERLSGLGVDAQDATRSIAALGQVKPELDAAVQRFGEDYTTGEQVEGLTTGLASAERKRKKLIEQEAGLFQERGRTNLSSNNVDQRGNSIEKRGDY